MAGAKQGAGAWGQQQREERGLSFPAVFVSVYASLPLRYRVGLNGLKAGCNQKHSVSCTSVCTSEEKPFCFSPALGTESRGCITYL